MKKIFKLDGKVVHPKDVPDSAVLVDAVMEVRYETPEYTKQQSINAHNYFAKQRELREDLEARHG